MFHHSFSWFITPEETTVNSTGDLHAEIKQPLGESLPRRAAPYDVVTLRFRIMDGYVGCVEDLVAFEGDAHRIYLATSEPPTYVVPDTVGMDEVAISFVDTFDCPEPADVYIDCESEADSYEPPPEPTEGGCVFLTWERINEEYVLLDGQTETGTGCFGSPLGLKRTYRWSDVCGNSCELDWLFIIELDQTPTGTIETPVTLPCNEIPDPNPNEVTATSYCGDPIPVEHPDCPDGDCIWWDSDVDAPDPNDGFCREVLRYYKVVDPCSDPTKVRWVSQYFRITDLEAPEITTCPEDDEFQCLEDIPMPENSLAGFTASGGEATDNCGVASASYSDDMSNYDPCGGWVTRTWTVEDTCYNTDTCDQVFTINDTIAPWFTTAPGDLTLECNSPGNATAIAAWIASAAADDNCVAAPTIGCTPGPVVPDCCDTYSQDHTWTATDACGNSVSHTATLYVIDTLDPSITCPPNVQVDCVENVPCPDTSSVTVSDQCCEVGEITVTWEGDSSDGNTCPETITRTYRATDDCGNWAECTQTITVWDQEDPVILCSPPDTFVANGILPGGPVEGAGSGYEGGMWYYYPDTNWWNVWFENEYAPDRTKLIHLEFDWWAAEPGTFMVALNYSTEDYDEPIPPLPMPPWGPGTVDPEPFILRIPVEVTEPGHVVWQYELEFCPRWVSVDIIGEGEFWIDGLIAHVCVEEVECSEIPPVHTSIEEFRSAGGVITDNCADEHLTLTVEETIEGNYCDEGGILTRTYTVTDQCGNAASCIQKFHVVDRTAPDITCPPDVTLECDESTDPNDTGWATATDNCDDDVEITYSDTSDGNTCPETITRTWTATDDCGLVSSCPQIIVVDDTVAPEITDMPEDIVVGAQDHACTYAVVTWNEPTITDNCDSSPTVTIMDNGTPVYSGYSFAVGTHTIRYTATDNCCNSSYEEFEIVVTDSVQLSVTVTLGGTGNFEPSDPPCERCILFEATDCAQPEVYVYQLMFFDETGTATAVFPVPCGQYECVRAQDPLHSLWNKTEDLTSEIINEGGGSYTVQYNAGFTLWLGNLTGFIYPPEYLDCIDIEDYVLFSYQYLTPVACNTNCERAVNGPAHADFTCDCYVGPEDYAFLALSFGQCDDEHCCNALAAAGGVPRTRISVPELKERGLGHLVVVDVDGDGWVDMEDCARYMEVKDAEQKLPDITPHDTEQNEPGAEMYKL